MLGQAPLVDKRLATHQADKRAYSGVPAHVHLQIVGVDKPFGADLTGVGPDTVVAHPMHLQLTAGGKGTRAEVAGKGALARVRATVLKHVALLQKGLGTVGTGKVTLAAMSLQVAGETRRELEGLAAHVAGAAGLQRMRRLVSQQVAQGFERLGAGVTLVGSGVAVVLEMARKEILHRERLYEKNTLFK